MKTTTSLFVGFLLSFNSSFSQNTFTTHLNIGSIKSFVMSNDDKCVLLSQYGSARITQIDTSSGTINWRSYINFPGYTSSFEQIVRTSDSNFVALLTRTGGGYSGISALKITSSGSILWVKKYFAPLTNQARDLVNTQDGGFIMVGGGCAGDNFAIRCDSLGNIVWQKQYIDSSITGGTAMNISYAGNDNYYISGNYLDTNNASNTQLFPNINLFKITGAGNLVWFRRINMSMSTSNYGLVTSSDGGATLTGSIADTIYAYTYLSHFDSSGNNLWHKAYVDDEDLNIGNDLIQVDDGGYIITGRVRYNDIRNYQMLNIKTDINGNIIWTRTGSKYQDGHGFDEGISIQPLSNTSFLVVGDNTFSKLNSNGYGWCYSDAINMTVITPSFSIVTPAYILNGTVNFIADTVTYSYTVLSGTVPGICTNITDVTDITGFEKIISIAPNPFSDVLKISVNDNLKYSLFIYDIALRRHLQADFTNSISVNTDHFANGIYFYELLGEDGSCNKGKVVKH